MKKQFILTAILVSVSSVIFAQVADSVAIREAILAAAKVGLTLIPPSPFSGVISLLGMSVIGMLAGWAIHHFGTKKGATIANEAHVVAKENLSAPIESTVKPETYMPNKH